MLSLTLVCALSALLLLPTTLAHMQMLIPSPLRDPHSNRVNEPKDYNILTPLHADGSDFACKGYQWNTPWTTVATYEAGKTYEMTLKGGATHGGGSCQISLSCDDGVEFKVLKSIVGGCPLEKEYEFTIPAEIGEELGRSKATCLLGWTWFNRVGNREMYMNCAVIDIVPPGFRKKPSNRRPQRVQTRDKVIINDAAQAALSAYPDLFVANLASVNDCVTKETLDFVFDDPGVDVAFGDGQGESSRPSFRRNKCMGKGRKNSGDLTPQSPGGSALSGNHEQWHGEDGDKQQEHSDRTTGSAQYTDGQWHPELYQKPSAKQSKPQAMRLQEDLDLQSVDVADQTPPYGAVEQELNAYLASLYGGKQQDEPAVARGVDATEDSNIAKDTQHDGEADELLTNDLELYPELADPYNPSYYRRTHTSPFPNDVPPAPDIAFEPNDTPSITADNDSGFTAFLERLNVLGETVFMLVKFASTYLDHPLVEGPSNQHLDANDEGSILQKRYVLSASPIVQDDKNSRDSGGADDEDPAQALMDVGIYVDGTGASKTPTVKQLESRVHALEDELSSLIKAIESAAKEEGYSGVEWTEGDDNINPSSDFDYDIDLLYVYPVPLTSSTKKYHKRQDSDAFPGYEDGSDEDEEAGAAEILFPDLQHDTLYEWLDPLLMMPFDWGQFYPDLEREEIRENIQSAEDEESNQGDIRDGRDDAEADQDEDEQPRENPAPIESPSSSTSEDTPPETSAVVSEESSGLEGNDDENEVDNTEQSSENLAPVTPPTPPTASNTATSNESSDQDDKPETLEIVLGQLTPGHDFAEPLEDPSPEEDLEQNEIVAQQSQADSPRHKPTSPSKPPPNNPNSEDTAIPPYFLVPGPVVPPGLNINNWPSPSNSSPNLENLPPLINDLGPGSEDEVRKWFALLNSLEKLKQKRTPARQHARQFDITSRPNVLGPESANSLATSISDDPMSTPVTPAAPPLAPSTLARLCNYERHRLLGKIAQWSEELDQPCGFGPNVAMPAPNLPELQDAMEQVCVLKEKRLVATIERAQELVEGMCEELVRVVGVVRGGV